MSLIHDLCPLPRMPFMHATGVRARAMSHLAEAVEAFMSLMTTAGGSDMHSVADGFLLALCGASQLQVSFHTP